MALEEGVEGREPEALAVEEGQRLDAVVVEPHPLVGVAHRHGEREVVLEQGRAGGGAERELGEGGGVDGGVEAVGAVEEPEQEDEELEQDEEEYNQDEEEYNQDEEEVLGMSQMDDAPEPSQPTQRTPRSKRGRKK